MKILQFIYSLDSGGAERFVVDLSNELSLSNELILYALRDDGLITNSHYKSEITGTVKYKNLKIKKGFNPFLIWKFYKIIVKENPDVVHCHLNLVNYFFLPSLVLKGKARFFYTMHSSAKAEVGSEFERLIRRFFFKHSYFCPVAISHETGLSYEKFYDLKDIKVIYNGRKSGSLSKDYNKVVDEIGKLKKSNGTLVFCHVARYNIHKNQKMLISVFNQLKNEGEDVILLVIGKGFEENVELRELAGSHIHFLGVRSNINDYLVSSDAFCLSSVNEGLPISLIEALSCGCIPVCTPVGGIVNIIKNGITGFISKSISETDYKESLLEFIKNRNKINKKSLTQFYMENLSIERCAENYLKLYKTDVFNK